MFFWDVKLVCWGTGRVEIKENDTPLMCIALRWVSTTLDLFRLWKEDCLSVLLLGDCHSLRWKWQYMTKWAQVLKHSYSQVYLMLMSHTTFLLHRRHSTAKKRSLGVNMAAPPGSMQATGLPHPTINPHTSSSPSTYRTGWTTPSYGWFKSHRPYWVGCCCMGMNSLTSWKDLHLLGVSWGHLHHIAPV